jgi:acetyltransferase
VTDEGIPVTLRSISRKTWRFRRTFSQAFRSARGTRFGRGDFQYSDDELRRLCTPAPGERAQFIAVARCDGVDRMIGSARYVVETDGRTCEMAIVVNDAWQGHGVGRRLMRALIEQARRDHLQTMVGKVLGSNAGMAGFARRQGFDVDDRTRPGLKTIVRPLGP